jgi:hypothetical protein
MKCVKDIKMGRPKRLGRRGDGATNTVPPPPPPLVQQQEKKTTWSLDLREGLGDASRASVFGGNCRVWEEQQGLGLFAKIHLSVASEERRARSEHGGALAGLDKGLGLPLEGPPWL